MRTLLEVSSTVRPARGPVKIQRNVARWEGQRQRERSLKERCADFPRKYLRAIRRDGPSRGRRDRRRRSGRYRQPAPSVGRRRRKRMACCAVAQRQQPETRREQSIAWPRLSGTAGLRCQAREVRQRSRAPVLRIHRWIKRAFHFFASWRRFATSRVRSPAAGVRPIRLPTRISP